MFKGRLFDFKEQMYVDRQQNIPWDIKALEIQKGLVVQLKRTCHFSKRTTDLLWWGEVHWKGPALFWSLAVDSTVLMAEKVYMDIL